MIRTWSAAKSQPKDFPAEADNPYTPAGIHADWISTMILIDAHGTDHGLKIELDNRVVSVTQWAQLCEPDENGDWCPHLLHFTCTLDEAMQASKRYSTTFASQASRLKTGAIDTMFRDGHDYQDDLPESAEPADYFSEDLDARPAAALSAPPQVIAQVSQ